MFSVYMFMILLWRCVCILLYLLYTIYLYYILLYTIHYSNQAVPIETIIQYNSIKDITNNIELIRQVLYESKVRMLTILYILYLLLL